MYQPFECVGCMYNAGGKQGCWVGWGMKREKGGSKYCPKYEQI